MDCVLQIEELTLLHKDDDDSEKCQHKTAT